METVLPDNFYEHLEKLGLLNDAPLFVSEFKHKLIGYSEIKDDYDGFFRGIIDDLETFYDVSKYPAVEVAISLLRDYSEVARHYPSKKTLYFLKNWRKQK